MARSAVVRQVSLGLSNEASVRVPKPDLGLTFRDSLKDGAFGWYPYVEGFSAEYTKKTIAKFAAQKVYDPFGGSGTTSLAASTLGVSSYYRELNPFMRFVADAKVNGKAWAHAHRPIFERICLQFKNAIAGRSFANAAAEVDLSAYYEAFPERDFFVERDLRQLVAARDFARQCGREHPWAEHLLLLAVAANVVKSSNMTRRADLRRRRSDEYLTRVVDVSAFIQQTLSRFEADIEAGPEPKTSTVYIGDDARAPLQEHNNTFDLVLTSPPYLNGTNYFRNTKLELWFLGFIQSERELGGFTRRAIAGGINNVRKDASRREFGPVEEVAAKLDTTADDARIPLLVRQYFSDMYDVLASVAHGLTASGNLVLDIGDSKFYGVHVPTDELLIHVAKEAGLDLVGSTLLARRHSRDKSPLRQVEQVFRARRR